MKTLGWIFGVIGALAVVCLVVGAVIFFSGAYNVGASTRHTDAVNSMLDHAMVRSVHAHARGLAVPSGVNLRDPALAQRAVADFNEMCLLCHGGPGMKPADWTEGLHPQAPDLTDKNREREWTDVEVYWIIKNGITDTGMSAFGATHDEDELWALTALTRQFLTLTPAQYKAMSDRARAEPEGAEEKGKQGSKGMRE